MKYSVIIKLFLYALVFHCVLSAEIVVNDIGDADDFSTSAPVYLIREAWENNYNIPGDDADFIHQETDTNFWTFTDAPSQTGLITARIIRMTTYAEFQTNAINAGDSVYLGIRYKDHLPVVLGAMPVYAHNGMDWVKVGDIGGAFDHAWKVAVIPVSSQQVAVTNNRYRFKIGTGFWGSGLSGDIPLDRIELATTQAELTVEADTPGFYPAAGDGNFPNLTKDSCWYVDTKPFFPIGFAAGWTGMSETSWQDMADAGFNTVVFNNWMVIQDPYAAGDVWDSLPSSGHYGFREFLNKSAEAGLQVIGVFQNDIKYAVVQNYFNTETATLQFVTDVCAMHRNHPALLAWSQVDEPDHSQIPEFYAPLEWCMALKDAVRKGDPDHPIYALEIRWRKGAFGHYKDICDYHGYDVYPAFGDPVSLIGERADFLVEETNGEKPFISYLKAYERTAEQAYMSFAEAYIALIHGAKGILYWSYGGSAPVWDTLSKIANEIDSLNHVILPPAITLDVNGKDNVCVNTQSPQVENIYKKGSDNLHYILTANTANQSANGIQFTVAGLVVGTEIKVLFENRTIAATAGAFQDDFAAYARHVYQFSSSVQIKGPTQKTFTTAHLRILQSRCNGAGTTFILNGGTKATLQVFTMKGRLITTLQGTTKGNQTSWTWNWNGFATQKVSNDMYIARIKTSNSLIAKPFVLLNQ